MLWPNFIQYCFLKLTELQCISVNMENNSFWGEICPNNLCTIDTSKYFNYTSKPCAPHAPIKFQSIWTTLDFGTIFVQKNMTDKNFEKR